MADYKIQIVIPVYNSEKTLEVCLDSIKKQSFKNWQVIAVDDKSTDNSLDILNRYAAADERIRVVEAEKNCGAAAARNLALGLVTSEYTAFLDSDDYWEPDMLETLISKAEKYNCDVVQCRYIYDFPGGKQYLPKGSFSKDVFLEGKGLKKVFLRMMTGINMNHVCMKLIKTSLLKDVRFDTSLPTAEDLAFCVKIFENVGSYYYTTKVMYHYCRWENSLTGKGLPFKTRLDANKHVSGLIIKTLPKWGINTPLFRILTTMRPYTIIVSKIVRVLREKIFTA